MKGMPFLQNEPNNLFIFNANLSKRAQFRPKNRIKVRP